MSESRSDRPHHPVRTSHLYQLVDRHLRLGVARSTHLFCAPDARSLTRVQSDSLWLPPTICAAISPPAAGRRVLEAAGQRVAAGRRGWPDRYQPNRLARSSFERHEQCEADVQSVACGGHRLCCTGHVLRYLLQPVGCPVPGIGSTAL